MYALACASCGGGGAATATEMPTTPRRPDGVVVEPPPALPPIGERAPARGVVALREPLSDEAVKEVVRSYFTLFEHEDLEGLSQLLTTDVISLDVRARGSRSNILEQWRARMRQLDYAKLAGLEVVQLDRLEHYGFDDLEGSTSPPRPSAMRAGDTLVKVPVSAARVAGERYFGDTLILLLRREEGHFKIAGVAEDDTP
ncbi:MAG: hypothetical protein JWM74_5502 [Myxococcaceae bacterium]|nr:hypothetical protein [Myxococcaceae bacterium]